MGKIRIVTSKELAELQSHIGPRAKMIFLEGRGCKNRQDFFSEMGRLFPMDPPLEEGLVWDALSDSLWGAIDSMRMGEIFLVWRAPEVLAHHSPKDYQTALDVLKTVATEVADPTTHIDIPTRFEILLLSSLGEEKCDPEFI